MYSIEFSESAEKQLYKLPEDIQKRIMNVLERIKIRPFYFIKRKEGTPYYLLRVGDYRAVLDVKTDQFIIWIKDVGHRKNIYKH